MIFSAKDRSEMDATVEQLRPMLAEQIVAVRAVTEGFVEGGFPQVIARFAKAMHDAFTEAGLPPQVADALTANAVATLRESTE